jgi:hypothetical protein
MSRLSTDFAVLAPPRLSLLLVFASACNIAGRRFRRIGRVFVGLCELKLQFRDFLSECSNLFGLLLHKLTQFRNNVILARHAWSIQNLHFLRTRNFEPVNGCDFP